MAKFDVVDLDLKKVGSSSSPTACSPPSRTRTCSTKSRRCSRSTAARHARGEEQLAGLRRRQEALEAEGHWPRSQGSIRASHWVGGGKAMGPKARDYTYRPPTQVRRGALRAALSLRAGRRR